MSFWDNKRSKSELEKEKETLTNLLLKSRGARYEEALKKVVDLKLQQSRERERKQQEFADYRNNETNETSPTRLYIDNDRPNEIPFRTPRTMSTVSSHTFAEVKQNFVIFRI